MNYNLTINPVPLPINPDRRVNLPIDPVADGSGRFRDANQQQPSTHVYRGEVVEAIANDKRYRPQLNLQVRPENQHAIDTYRKVQSEPPLVGQLLDGFI